MGSTRIEADLHWVSVAPIAELARQWIRQHPGTTMRRLALSVAAIVTAMGYSTSPNTIQPILGGHKKKTRGFIYRAMLELHGLSSSAIPEQHRICAAKTHLRHPAPPPESCVESDAVQEPASGPRIKSILADEQVETRTGLERPKEKVSSFTSYRMAIQRFIPLDRETELELATRWRRDGDQSAANSMIESHLPFVVKVAMKYRGYGMQLADLIEEGNLGLIEAARRFEPSRKLRFKTYAIYWIRAFIVDHLLREWSIVGGGSGALVSRTFFRLRRERARLEMQLGEGNENIDAMLAARFRTTEDSIRSMSQRVATRDASLEAQLFPDGPSLLETLRDQSADPEHEVASAERNAFVREVIERVFSTLDPRERLIIEERLLTDEDGEVSLADLGRRFGVSRERIRQLEARAKSKLRVAIEAAAGNPPALFGRSMQVRANSCPIEPDIDALCA